MQNVINLFGTNALRLGRRTSATTLKWNVDWRRRMKAFKFCISARSNAPGSTFVVTDLNQLYIKNLKSFGIEEKAKTTRFTQRFLNSKPNLVSSTVKKVLLFCFEIKLINSL